MNYLPAVALILLCSGCQQNSLNAACRDSAAVMASRERGSLAHIDVSFSITLNDRILNVKERAICEYQGSFCPAGEWYEVWYGDQSIEYEFDLQEGERLILWPHGFCTSIDEFKKKCRDGQCVAKEHFQLRLDLSDARTCLRREECGGQASTSDPDEFLRCALPEVDLVTYSELEEYGYNVESFDITVSGIGLGRSSEPD